MAAGVVVGVDFGTSFTVAALRRGSDPPRVIEVAGSRRTPSVVFAEEDGSLVVGTAAEALTDGRPARGLRAPKQLLGRSEIVVLGGTQQPLSTVIGGLLGQVLRHADREAQQPTQLVFTHPADWTERQLVPFREALAQAGASAPQLVTEPVAGAWAQAAGHGHRPGDHLLVYDLGGGTLDIAVLEAQPSGFTVVGNPSGNRALGGDLFDEVLMAHVAEQHLDQAAQDELQLSDDPAWTSCAVRLRGAVRRAKELLSLHPRADLAISLPHRTFVVTLSRTELAGILRPMVEESVQLCEDAVRAAGLPLSSIAAVHLIGGGSQLPSVGEAIGARFPLSELVLAADPKAVVALGATLLAAPHPPTGPPATSVPAASIPTWKAAGTPVVAPPESASTLPSPVGAVPPSATAPVTVPSMAVPSRQAGISPDDRLVVPDVLASADTMGPSPAAFRVHEGAQLGAQRRHALLVLSIAVACIFVAVFALIVLM